MTEGRDVSNEIRSPQPDELGKRLEAARSGDIRAQQELSRALTPRLQAFARRCLSLNLHDAEDNAQEVLLRAMDPATPFVNLGYTFSWLTKIARRHALKAQRQINPRLVESKPEPLDASHKSSMADQARALQETFEDAIAELAPKERDALLTEHASDVARQHEVSERAVYMWQRAARGSIARYVRLNRPDLYDEYQRYMDFLD